MKKRSIWILIINTALTALLALRIYRDLTFGKEWGLISPPIAQVISQERIGLLFILALILGAILEITSSKGAALVNSLTSVLLIGLAMWTAVSLFGSASFWKDLFLEIIPVVAVSIINILLYRSSISKLVVRTTSGP